MLGDRGQVHRLQPAQRRVQLGDGAAPLRPVHVFGQRVRDLLQYEARLGHRLGQAFGLQHQRLLVEPPLADRLALGERLLVALVADLLVPAQVVVDPLQHAARLVELLLAQHALFQGDLALLLELGHRVAAAGKLLAQLAEAAVELAALSPHALQCLGERGDLGALGLQGQRERVDGVARGAGQVAGLVACLGEPGPFALQLPAAVLQLRHPGDGLLLPCARLLRLRRGGGERFGQLRELGLDAFDAAAGAVQAPLLSLQLPAQLRDAPVRGVEAALGLLALLLGGAEPVAQRGKCGFQFLLALLELRDACTQLLDFALAQQGALAGVALTQHLDPAGTDAFAGAGHHHLVRGEARQQRRGLV